MGGEKGKEMKGEKKDGREGEEGKSSFNGGGGTRVFGVPAPRRFWARHAPGLSYQLPPSAFLLCCKKIKIIIRQSCRVLILIMCLCYSSHCPLARWCIFLEEITRS